MKKFSVLLLAFLLVISLTGCKGSDYKQAMELYANDDYAAALAIFTELGDYKDSSDMVCACKYEIAQQLLLDGDYEGALAVFEELGDYKDCREQIEIVLEKQKSEAYAEAFALLEIGNYQQAYAAFEALGDYRDSATQLTYFTYKTSASKETNYSIINNTTQKLSSEYAVHYTYDSAGRLLSEEADNHYETDYIYDENGCLVKTVKHTVWDVSAKKYTVAATSEYDPAGNLIGYTYTNEKLGTTSTTKYENEFYPSGILKKQTFVSEAYVDFVQTDVSFYDEQGRETVRNVTKVYRKDSRVEESRQEYVYDNYGNLSEIKFYDYRDYGLLEKGSTIYTNRYDQNGNLLSTQITYANGNSGALFEYTYDDSGNVLTYTQKSNGIALVERQYYYELMYFPGTE